MNRTPLHKGYYYQDLVTAFFMIEAVADGHQTVYADQEFPLLDKIDDITINHGNNWVKCQVKHSTNGKLAVGDLKNASGDLRFALLVETHVQFTESDTCRYRTILRRDLPDGSDKLWIYLLPVDEPCILVGVQAKVFRLDGEKLWPEGGAALWSDITSYGTDRESFLDFVDKFRLEVEWPHSSFNLEEPGELEELFFAALRDRLGIGIYPNQTVPIQHVAAGLVSFARECRVRGIPATSNDIIKRLELRTDFGRVVQRFPIDPQMFVSRDTIADDLSELLTSNRMTLLVGEPGSGKSWLLTKLAEKLSSEGLTVCKHYCYLDPSDNHVEERIKTEVLYGNLIADIVDVVPVLAHHKPTLFGADRGELEALLAATSEALCDTVVIVDGLDHVFRVFEGATDLTQNETQIIEAIAELKIPDGVHLLLGSQPGGHIRDLEERADCASMELPAWSRDETEALVKRMEMEDIFSSESVTCDRDLISMLKEHCEGNALYTTYLLRGVESLGENEALVQYLEGTPVVCGDISQYYRHLLNFPSAPGIEIILELLSLLPFSVTGAELKDVHPHMAHKVDEILIRLRPVLRTSAGQGGVRIYHESLRRFTKEQLIESGADIAACLRPVVDWLQEKGFWTDDRAFRFLIMLEVQANLGEQVLHRIDSDFVWQSIRHGHNHNTIDSNLLKAARIASTRADFPALCQIAQLRRAATACFEDNLFEMTTYAKAFIALNGAQALADKLLFEGRVVFDAEAGLNLCLLCDQQGAVVPWAEYMAAYDLQIIEQIGDPEFQETLAVSLAMLRGRLVTEGHEAVIPDILEELVENVTEEDEAYAYGLLELLAEFGGISPMMELIREVSADCFFASMVRERLVGYLVNSDLDAAQKLVDSFAALSGQAEKLKYFYSGLTVLIEETAAIDPVPLTITMVKAQRAPDHDAAKVWAEAVQLLAISEPTLLGAIREMIPESNWYMNWLHFVIRVSELAALNNPEADLRSRGIVLALTKLAEDTDPFKGQPRACDLFGLHKNIRESLSFALSMLLPEHDHWLQALDALKAICSGTTTYLSNSESGPLGHYALISLLANEVTNNGVRNLVLTTIGEVAEDAEQSGTYFSNQAENSLVLAEQLGRAGLHEAGQESFRKACIHLCAYTFRKDVTFLELLRPIREVATLDKGLAIGCLQKSQHLIAKISSHTDGRETAHFPNAWFKELCITDIDAAMRVLVWASLEDGASPCWIYEASTLYVAQTVGVGTSHGLRLLCTLPSECPLDGSVAVEVLEALAQASAIDASSYELVARVAAQITDTSYTVTMDLVRRVNELPASMGVPVIVDDGVRKDDNSHSSYVSPESQPKVHYAIPTIPMDLGKLKASAIVRLMRGLAYDVIRSKELSERLAGAIGYRLCELIQEGSDSDAELLLDAITSTRPSGLSLSLDSIADGLARHGHVEAAACILARAYIISFDAYQSNERVSCSIQTFRKALSLSKPVAVEQVSREALRVLETSGYAFGVSPALTCASVAMGDIDSVDRCWKVVYGAISERIPDDQKYVDAFPDIPPPRIGISDEVGVAALVFSRLAHPDWLVRTMSFGCALELIVRSPETVYCALPNVLERDLTLASLTNILALLAGCVEQASAPQDFIGFLVSLRGSSHLCVNKLAEIILNRVAPEDASSEFPIAQLKIAEIPLAIRDIDGVFSFYPSWRREQLERIWPGFTEKAAQKALGTLLTDGSRRLARKRIEAFRPQSTREIPARFIGWPDEIIDLAINEIGCGLDAILWRQGEWTKEKSQDFCDAVMPAAIPRARYALSRVPRPRLPTPVNVHNGISLPSTVDDGTLFADWLRVAWMETQLVYDEKAHRQVNLLRHVYAGLVIAEEGDMLPDHFEVFQYTHSETWTSTGDQVSRNFVLGCRAPVLAICKLDDINGELGLLTWHPAVLETLRLARSNGHLGCVLVSEDGTPATMLRWWWTKPSYKAYNSSAPEYEGCEVLMRADLVGQLETVCEGIARVVTKVHDQTLL